MNLKEVESMVRTAHLVGNGLDMNDVKRAFGSVQDGSGSSEDHRTELVFTEFIFMMQGLALFKRPNPFEPVARRIADFLRDDVYKALEGVMKFRSAPMKSFKKPTQDLGKTL
jgi:hypothetical protein